MLRPHYTGLFSRQHLRSALAAAAACLLPGCSLSIPMLGGDDAPATTGSIAAPVQVQQPLPQSLAYSDATKIGQTAVAALSQVDKGGDWINSATGSSGTVESGGASEPADGCSPFNTMVTSIGGVHRYTGKICRGKGLSVVQIDAPA